MHILDILILVGFGWFIYTRFFSTKLPRDPHLGKRKAKGKKPNPFQSIQKASTKQHGAPKQGPKVVPLKKAEADDGKVPGLVDIKKAMPDFREKDFMAGAKKSYRYFYDQRNAMDDEALEPLLAPHVLDEVIVQMEEVAEKGHVFATDVKTIDAVDMLEARLNGRTALIDVQFTATQADNVKDADGNMVGSTKRGKQVKTIWTFARPVDSEDPNWDVTAMEAVN